MQICDEAHRCAGRSTKRDAQPLSDGFLRASRRLFLTATPRLLGAKRDKEGELLATASMDDQALFGRVAYRLAYSDAVARRLVAPLKLVFLDLTKLAEEYRLAPQPASSLVALGDAGGGGVASRELAELSAALLDCHRQHGVRTAFAFCANNARAAELERVARSSLAAHGVALGRVSGRMSAPARARVLDPVRRAASSPLPAEPGNGSMAIVTNCRVLGEGVDLPAVDLVVFADAKQRCVQEPPPSSLAHCASTHPAACACALDRSHVDILQCMGRASRLSPGKEYGHVLVPMAEEDESAFETAVSVVRAYAEQDEELKEALAFLVAEEARLGRPLQRVEWPEVLQAAIVLPADAMSVQRMLGERLVATVAVELVDRWERMYGLLQAYRAREGSANVPNRHEEGGEKLGLWLSRQLWGCAAAPGRSAPRMASISSLTAFFKEPRLTLMLLPRPVSLSNLTATSVFFVPGWVTTPAPYSSWVTFSPDLKPSSSCFISRFASPWRTLSAIVSSISAIPRAAALAEIAATATSGFC